MKKGDPLAIIRWWHAVEAGYPRDRAAPVLRVHLGMQEFLVLARDLAATAEILESLAPPGREDGLTNSRQPL